MSNLCYAVHCVMLSIVSCCPLLQGHEHYNPQKKNYIFMRAAAEELKPRQKKR